jgi:hypothetical protein
MKRLFFTILILILAWPSYAVPPAPSSGVNIASDCDVAKYYPIGKLCQDSDDGKLYKGTGSGVTEIAAGSSGDVTAATTDITWGDGTGPSVFTFSVTGTDPTITATASKIAIGGTLDLGAHDLTMTGSLGATGARLAKGWFDELEITALPTINGTSIHTAPIFATSILPAAATTTIGSATAEWGGLYLGDSKIIYGQADQSNTLTSSATGWTAALNLSAAAFVPTSAANANGEIGYASNAFSLFANSEDLTLTASADRWTIASGTSALITLTPATTITGQLTMTANPRIYDGNSHHLTIDASDLTADATVVIGSDTNNLTIANGTAGIDIAAGATLNVDTSLTVDTAAVTLKGKSGGSTITLPTALDLDETHVDGKLCAYTASGTKIVCDQDPAAGAGDFKADGTVPMTAGIQFEGTADDFETTLTATDPTADNTITLPNSSGTVALTTDKPATAGAADTATALAADPADCAAGQVATGIAASGALSCTATPSVTTLTGNVTGVASGNIANTLADAAGDMIYATADDTWAKLSVGTQYQIIQSTGSAPEWTSSLSITALDLTSATSAIPQPLAATASKPATCTQGSKWQDSTTGIDYSCTATNTWSPLMKGAGTVTDNTLVLFNGTTGSAVDASTITVGTDVNFQALNLVTTGTMSGKIPIISKSGNYTLGSDSAQEAYGYMVFLTGDGTVLTLPEAVAGMSVCVYSADSYDKVIDPNAADGIRNGTTTRNANGHSITSGATDQGSFACLIADSGDGWTVLGKAGTWTDE